MVVLRRRVLGISQPLRTREQLEADLRSSEERFRMFMNQSPFLAFIKDSNGRFLFYNHRLAERFHITETEWLGKHVCDIWPAEIANLMHMNDLEVLGSDVSIERLEQTKDAEGSLTTWNVHKFSWTNELGESFIGGIGFDMTLQLVREQALAEATLKLEKLATIDSLTGLANRRVLDERIEIEFRGARRKQTPLSVVLLDIDNFKLRNDRFGHATGDRVLSRLGHLVLDTLRITDLAGRYGGEELVVILPGATAAGARIYTERLRAAMRQEAWEGEPVTASFGIATLEAGTASGRQLIARADCAMYAAKRAGKGRIADEGDSPQNTPLAHE